VFAERLAVIVVPLAFGAACGSSTSTEGAGGSAGAGPGAGGGAGAGAGGSNAAGTSGSGGSGGGSGSGGSSGSSGDLECADPAFACWPMPNPASTTLPNPASYDTSQAGMAEDEVTGLVWQRELSTELYAWPDAGTYCEELELGGARWRLPTRIELVSLVDFTHIAPAIDESVFPAVSGNFWSASEDATSSSRAWQLTFATGATSTSSKTLTAHVRCVRAGTPPSTSPGRYRTTGNGPDNLVEDLGTGLVWQGTASDATADFAGAQTLCAELELDGGGFRVPSVKELQTLIDNSKTEMPVVSAVFSGIPSGRALFWTSSKSASSDTGAWFVNLGTGEAADVALTVGDVVDLQNFVLCVR
jgi:hypothetical protein